MSAPPGPAIRPLNGKEYLETLRDGREIWIHGERIDDVTAHPAFRNAARMVARLYDALHDPARKALLTAEADTALRGPVHRFYLVPRSAQDLVGARDAIAEWARLTYGWMGQSPDHGASLLAALGAAPEIYEPYHDNARRWYREACDRTLFFHHAVGDVPTRREQESREVPMRVEEESGSGLVVSGAKVVATCSALSHHGLIVHRGVRPARGEEFSLSFVAPMSGPGIKLMCRPTSAMMTKHLGSPFDHPLTSRLDESDAILIFDRALIPWENVLVHGDAGGVRGAYQRAALAARASFQGSTRLSVKLEFVAGLLLRAVEAAGTGDLREVQAALGEVLSYRNLFWGLTEAQARAPVPWTNNAVLPNPDHGLSFRIFSTLAQPRLRDLIERAVGNGHVYLAAQAVDFMNPETRAYLERFVRGANGHTALDRVKLTKLLWDAVGSETSQRYEAQSADGMRADVLSAATASGLVDHCKAFAEKCLGEYDLEGWKVPDLVTPEEALASSRRRPW
jgi:4-hydroxyphenylacetate 3-monooxygenase